MNDTAKYLFHDLKRLWFYISDKRKKQFKIVLFLTMMASFSEMMSIGVTLPFLSVLVSPERLFNSDIPREIFNGLGYFHASEILMPLTVVFCLTALFAGIFRLVLLRYSIKLTFAMGADLSVDVYRRTLYQPYDVHIARNSSEVISGISEKVNVVIYCILLPVLVIISSAIIFLAVLIILMGVNTFITGICLSVFAVVYLVISWYTRSRLALNGELSAKSSTLILRLLQEGLGSIRDILIDSSQQTYINIYRKTDGVLRSAQANTLYIIQSPRFIMEAVGMILLALIAYLFIVNPNNSPSEVIPIFGVLVLAAQRLLPIAQQAYGGWSTMRSNHAFLGDLLKLLEQPLPSEDSIERGAVNYRDLIYLKNISFKYSSESDWVLRGIDLLIKKGDRIGIIGETGSGKSTLLDILMGLLSPVSGNFKIDGLEIRGSVLQAEWRRQVAHVPQSIYLADASVEENIAIGVPHSEIDFTRVQEAAKKACIHDFIMSMPSGYKTFVGERGIRLSGGQRQRIGIARALYKEASIVIFDEATSALDDKTEIAVMEEIQSLSPDLTILVVAHRLSTLYFCSRIIKISNGCVVENPILN